ncbi:MAG TPA: D-amino acid aminotransferase [Gammaproteobacteria bacterium]|nr:D-amino acid aminotransferase [Gammaproteobacteria bacterium]
MPIIYLNGQFIPPEQAMVSVMDRGYLFGDGVYEVIPAYNGKPFRLDAHLKRLHNSLSAIRIREPMSTDTWRAMIEDLLQRNPGTDQSIYVQVTRGVAPKRDHAFDDSLVPAVFAMVNPIAPADPAVERDGIKAITLDDIRWHACNIKAITLLPNVLLRQQAIDAGAAEAILIRNGYATEGAASNLFVVKRGLLITPPKGPQLLPGITRDVILELAAHSALPYREGDISETDLHDADEIWVTSSTKEILPITQLDDKPIGTGKPGPVYRRMSVLYGTYKEQVRSGEAT